MIDFYLDCEFSGHAGWLMSMALVHDRHDYLYLVAPETEIAEFNSHQPMDPWVAKNVVPLLMDVPSDVLKSPRLMVNRTDTWGSIISEYLYHRPDYPHIICDWPVDLTYFTELLITGPGIAVPMEDRTHATILRHIDVYPTTLGGAVQHNAWWDALAIKQKVLENRNEQC